MIKIIIRLFYPLVIFFWNLSGFITKSLCDILQFTLPVGVLHFVISSKSKLKRKKLLVKFAVMQREKIFFSLTCCQGRRKLNCFRKYICCWVDTSNSVKNTHLTKLEDSLALFSRSKQEHYLVLTHFVRVFSIPFLSIAVCF